MYIFMSILSRGESAGDSRLITQSNLSFRMLVGRLHYVPVYLELLKKRQGINLINIDNDGLMV